MTDNLEAQVSSESLIGPSPESRELVEALRAPSFQQDSRWHHPKACYATKPKDLLDQAASTIEAQAARTATLEEACDDLFAEMTAAHTVLEPGAFASAQRLRALLQPPSEPK